MLRGIWGDPERYKATYWSTYADRYFAGDGANWTKMATYGSSVASTT